MLPAEIVLIIYNTIFYHKLKCRIKSFIKEFGSKGVVGEDKKISNIKVFSSTEDPENITTGKESIDCLYSGEPMIIGYNSQYLGDVLKNQNTEEIKILFKSPLTAGIFLPKKQQEDEEKTTLLMPIRLND